MHNFLNTAVRAAKAAGAIQRERFGSRLNIEYKGEINLVTEVDMACEAVITSIIRADYPDHDILAEESGLTTQSSKSRWIVDPLDGTTNYAHAFPWFCVSIALELAGTVEVGVIYQPLLDELFTVVRGSGAYLNDIPLKVSQRSPLKQCLLATGFPYDRTRNNENNLGHFCNFQLEVRGVRRAGAAALDLAYVAAGRLDGYWECKLHPWDVAAGRLLVEEAGGRVTNHMGESYSVYDHRILASNGLIHDEMLQILSSGESADGFKAIAGS